MQENKIALFEEKEIRRAWYNEDWYFSVEDVVQILTDSVDVKQYIKKLKARDSELNNNWGTICTLVEMIAKDGKKRKVMNTAQYKELKGISNTKRNLRDSMGNLELAITNLAEVTANEMHNTNNSFGLNELKDDVQEAGKITGKARREIEEKIGKKIADKSNYKKLTGNTEKNKLND